MTVTCKNSSLALEGDSALLGYSVEPVELKTLDGQKASIAFLRGKLQIVVSLPFLDEQNLQELRLLNDGIPQEAKANVRLVSVFGKNAQAVEGFDCLIDSEGEFGDNYGVRIADGKLAGELAKAIFIITKDGSLFYKYICADLSESLDMDKLFLQLTKAYATYSGKGCEEI